MAFPSTGASEGFLQILLLKALAIQGAALKSRQNGTLSFFLIIELCACSFHFSVFINLFILLVNYV